MLACRLVAGLLEWMGCGESRQREAALCQLRYDRKSRQIELQEMRADHLAGDADIGKAGLGTQRKRRRRSTLKQAFVGRESLGRPMLAPLLDRVSIGAERLGEMIADPGNDQRMGICD